MDRRSFLESSTLAAAGVLIGGGRPAPAQTVTGRNFPLPIVETAAGRVRGTIVNHVKAFRGIPYGASTAGPNRFLPPQKVEPWGRVRDARDIGPRAPQLNTPRVPEFAVMDRWEPQSEDCLTLNVWTPVANATEQRPVLVWLHGGSFSSGSAGYTLYDGANLARRHDVVVVGVNHRLNLFGFLYLGDIGGEKYATANAGMLDIVAALEWVRDNAERFGGDPKSVAVFGSGEKVSTLFGMPAARGLFHRGIAMSGSQVRGIPREQATRTTERLLARLNVRPGQLDELQRISMRRLRAQIRDEGGEGAEPLVYGPVVDGRTLPGHPFDPVASDLLADVPLMIGSTETEVTWNVNQFYDPLTDEQLQEDLMRALRTDAGGAQQVIAAYRTNRPTISNLDIYLIAASDASTLRTGTDLEADRKAAQRRAPVYKYYFQWYSPVRGGMLRAMHGMDAPFAFYNQDVAITEIGTGPRQVEMAERLSAALVAFARTGRPDHRLIPAWPAYDTARRQTMVMNNEWQVVSNPYGEEKAAIEAGRNRHPQT
ncbi:MAG TPA: carboxylesterase family protein [Vicinamibacterales bacterium]|nr:carboxylesterase family protein [Vicinamibacterales bacterium]